MITGAVFDHYFWLLQSDAELKYFCDCQGAETERLSCNKMSHKVLMAFSRAQKMLFGIKRASSRKSPSYLHISYFSYSRGREDDFEDKDVIEAELDDGLGLGVSTSSNLNSARNFKSNVVTRSQLLREEDEGRENLEESETTEAEMESDGGEIPTKIYYRAKQLVTILKKKQEEIYKEFTLRHRKRYYTFQNGIFYEFSSSKEIIIDEDAILKSKNQRNILNLIKSKRETRRDYISYQNHVKTPVIVILGHFNHGKTTLLDSLGNFSIVEKEAHGITQVKK